MDYMGCLSRCHRLRCFRMVGVVEFRAFPLTFNVVLPCQRVMKSLLSVAAPAPLMARVFYLCFVPPNIIPTIPVFVKWGRNVTFRFR